MGRVGGSECVPYLLCCFNCILGGGEGLSECFAAEGEDEGFLVGGLAGFDVVSGRLLIRGCGRELGSL